MASGNFNLKSRAVGALTPLTYTTNYNCCSAEPYAVQNVVHRQYTFNPPTRAVTSFNQVASFSFQKTFDMFDRLHLQIVLNPATFTVPQTVEQYVDGLGYRIIEKANILLNINNLNTISVPWQWRLIQDTLFYDDDTVFIERQLNLAGKTAAALRADLAAGVTIYPQIEFGFHKDSKECMFMVVAYANLVTVNVQLASAGDCIYAPSLGSNISNLNTIVNTVQFVIPEVHLMGDERIKEVNRYDADNGLFCIVHNLEMITGVIPVNQPNHTIDLQALTYTYEALFLILQPTGQQGGSGGVPFQNDPCFWTGPTMTPIVGGGVCYQPDSWDITGPSNVYIHTNVTQQYAQQELKRRFFPQSSPNGWIIVATFSEDVTAQNATLGNVDFTVYGTRMWNLHWLNGAVSSTGSATWTYTIIAAGPNFRHTQQGSGNMVF